MCYETYSGNKSMHVKSKTKWWCGFERYPRGFRNGGRFFLGIGSWCYLCALLLISCFDSPSDSHGCDECLPCESCVQGEGDDVHCEADKHALKQCTEDGNVHWFDSCDLDEGVAEQCPSQNAECVNNLDDDASCVCLNHWEGADCSTCPPGWDPNKECNACKEKLDPSEDCGACLGNWDVEYDCDLCQGNWDPEQDCDECKNHWIDNGDNCGTCPANFDPDKDCFGCKNRWTGEDCDVCPGNWDAEKDCGECRNHWTGDDCQTCPGGWDEAEDCDACGNHWTGDDCQTCPEGWDATQDCNQCDSNWTGENCDTCPGNWDPADNCDACRNHWEGDDCEICPENRDPATDCDTCLNQWVGNDCDDCPGNFDPDTGCDACLPGWTGTDCDVQPICTRYVDLNSTLAFPDGFCWSRAFSTIQEGIDAAAGEVSAFGGPSYCEVWVAQGRYYIYESSKDDTVALAYDVHLYGGFAGDETTRGERDIDTYPTILDGHMSLGSTEQVFHVVTGSDLAIIDGFTITGGKADDEWGVNTSIGGGMLNYEVSPRIANCTFEGNYALAGGGVYNYVSYGLSIENCRFSANTADNYGGGLRNYNATVSIVDTTFSLNDAHGGGGMDNSGSVTSLERCVFDNNSAVDGAGIYAKLGGLTISSSVFIDNDATNAGGAIYAHEGLSDITNSTFYSNSATNEGGGGIYHAWIDSPDITNCIFWSNYPNDFSTHNSSYPTVTYSDTQDGDTGDGNISLSPQFVDTASGDLSLQPGSPCIDAADGNSAPTLDMDGNSRVDDPATTDTGVGSPTYTDMGAFEYQP
ncbi:MAG: hypothetical protein GY854_10925 [Deltaproteobacteria bacterium]|nr:hypothetical protein [Deltaproteobacteria bacterium]